MATTKQVLSAVAVLIQNLDERELEVLDQEMVHRSIIRNGPEAGQEFMRFLRNGARVQVGDFFRSTGELTLQLPALPRPTLETLQGKYSWIKSIEGDNSPTEATKLELGTVFYPDEKSSINGTEYEYRLGSAPYLGFQHACWLVDHQDELDLAPFKALLGKVYIDFPGLKVVSSGGRRLVPYLSSDDERWYVNFFWLGGVFSGLGRVARPCK